MFDIKDLRKVYPGFGGRPPKPATKSFCLRIKKGEMFGLLGPNGAGKTTLISMLIGLYPPNRGNAWVAGYDIRDQLEVVQLQIGVCPQFDILWNDLTVEEHLLFYARMKGIPPEKEMQQVNKAVDEVLLHQYRKLKVKQLSGGMKRRLSVAISLVSEPKIIYLDEPSTGLDPENRRQLWDILAQAKGKRAIILTTHSMEEADVLCNRIGIVNDGILRCVGPQIRLKSIYGGGYHLFINCQRGKILQMIKHLQKRENRRKQSIDKSDEYTQSQIQSSRQSKHNKKSQNKDKKNSQDDTNLELSEVVQRVAEFIQYQIPTSILIREFNGNFVYQVPTDGFMPEKFFLDMEKNKARLRITDWGISQCSLEDVFLRICETK